MIKEIKIENYKSIEKLKIDLGRITILIGENGCGKTNILEALALASASACNKLDNEFLAARGIRVTEPQFMHSAFNKENITKEIRVCLKGQNDIEFNGVFQNDNNPYSKWLDKGPKQIVTSRQLIEYIEKYTKGNQLTDDAEISPAFFQALAREHLAPLHLDDFLIYSPETPSLRTFMEGQIEPLGIKGEGLFKLLKVLTSDKNKEKLDEIKSSLKLIAWFKDFNIPNTLSEGENYIQISDKYLDDDLACFDQKSSNEGFLLLLFYFALFISSDTPEFFAVDNIDASLNPKLCSKLTKELVKLAKKQDKQAIFTTHNPAILDGLNLDDPEQKLFVIYRNKSGHTKARRILKPKTPEDQEPVKMSEAFLRGYIGGLPKGF